MENIIELLEKASENSVNGIFDGKLLTYSELEKNSQIIASGLLESGLTAQPIAVFAVSENRTIELMMGIIRSGCYYVLIDPESPDERMASMLSGVDTVLIGGKEFAEVAERLKQGGKRVYFYDDLIIGKVSYEKLKAAAESITASSPLMMVYTSGSTGTPKGVIKSHGAMLSFVSSFLKEYPISDSDCIGNQTPLYFDASSKDIYLSLATGATLKFIPKQLFSFPAKLIEFLNNEGITAIFWVPSALTIVAKLRTFEFIKPEKLRQVFFVGEVFRAKYLNYWIENLPDCRFVNLYGSSEMAGVVCTYRVPGKVDENSSLPIGRPLENTHIYIVESDGGEMVVESDALATGYKDEKQTQERFFTVRDGKRLRRFFKTGDLVSVNENGDFVFKSRNDSQIKLMGHRIELGEIDTAAYSIDEISDACTLFNAEREKIVMFYSLLKPAEESEIRDKLLKRIPKYMLPSKLIFLEQMPKNNNGKIDRVKLKNLLEKI